MRCPEYMKNPVFRNDTKLLINGIDLFKFSDAKIDLASYVNSGYISLNFKLTDYPRVLNILKNKMNAEGVVNGVQIGLKAIQCVPGVSDSDCNNKSNWFTDIKTREFKLDFSSYLKKEAPVVKKDDKKQGPSQSPEEEGDTVNNKCVFSVTSGKNEYNYDEKIV